MSLVPDTAFRPDIQGLRAIAVLTVLLFHVWPHALPGGYVGVDVFFVISGYLITTILVRELDRTGSLSFGAFYARRIRRLLPAASLVLLFVAAGTVLVVPQFKWAEVGKDIAASALYVQNWRLSWNAVDYLAAEEAAGPLKHYWSLAIEEQFYIVWPALLLLFSRVPLRSIASRGRMLAGGLLVTAASLFFSVAVTESDPATAYFATHTRIWELGAGCLLALLPLRSSSAASTTRLKLATGWTGLAMVGGSAWLYSAETAFPGLAAVVPTLGAALLIHGGDAASPASVGRFLGTKPMLFLGDISYSLYLWHWPLIVFATYLYGEPGLVAGMVLLATSLVVSWLSKRYVEDSFRHANHGWGSRIRAPRMAMTAMVLCLCASAAIHAAVARKSEDWAKYALDPAYPGAAALTGAAVPGSVPFIPSLEAARSDLADAYENGCHQRPRHLEPKGCQIGDPEGERRVVLVGDSHAANWIPAFEEIGETSGWDIRSYTKSACSLTLVDMTLRGKPYKECTEWSANLIDELRELRPDAIVIGRSRGPQVYGSRNGAESNQRETAALIDLFNVLKEISPVVIAIRDTPRMPFDPPECLAGQAPCRAGLDRAMAGFDPLLPATKAVPEVSLLDMTDAICDDTGCDSVVGNVLVWRDRHHLTATYSRSLAKALHERIALAARRRTQDVAWFATGDRTR